MQHRVVSITNYLTTKNTKKKKRTQSCRETNSLELPFSRNNIMIIKNISPFENANSFMSTTTYFVQK